MCVCIVHMCVCVFCLFFLYYFFLFNILIPCWLYNTHENVMYRIIGKVQKSFWVVITIPMHCDAIMIAECFLCQGIQRACYNNINNQPFVSTWWKGDIFSPRSLADRCHMAQDHRHLHFRCKCVVEFKVNIMAFALLYITFSGEWRAIAWLDSGILYCLLKAF